MRVQIAPGPLNFLVFIFNSKSHFMSFLVIGNITKDYIVPRTGGTPREEFGGAVYSALAASRLGYDTYILSRVNPLEGGLQKFLERLYEQDKIKTHVQTDSNITTFKNDYSSGERVQTLERKTGKIGYSSAREEFVSDEFETVNRFDIIHISPVFQEIDVELVKRARKDCKRLSLDVQGLVRDKTTNGRVVGTFLEDREQYLRYVDILKASESELYYVSKSKNFGSACEELKSLGAKVIVITLGERGSTVYDGTFYNIPAFKVDVVDETGAGDVYAAAFSIRYLETNNVIKAGSFASAAAFFPLKDFGPASIAARKDVEKKLQEKPKRAAKRSRGKKLKDSGIGDDYGDEDRVALRKGI